ncbi:MAG: hypothetical protein WBF63_03945 [Moheibacter sp.]
MDNSLTVNTPQREVEKLSSFRKLSYNCVYNLVIGKLNPTKLKNKQYHMASCFIIYKDGRCFSRRWSGYDYIIKIAIRELKSIENGLPLANWLELQIPIEDIEIESDSCYGFYNSRIDDWVNRYLDIRSLTPENQKLFWEAITKGRIKLINEGKNYSELNLDYFERFYKMYELAENGEPPMDYNDWGKLAEPCSEKNGPGW